MLAYSVSPVYVGLQKPIHIVLERIGMATSTLSNPVIGSASIEASRATLVRQAFRALQLGFVVAPILAGVDKFLNMLVNWEQYLAPTLTNLLPFEASTFMG